MKPYEWTKAYGCDAGSCVETFLDTEDGGLIFVRNSAEPSRAAVSFTAEEWRVFVQGVKDGEFDV